MGVLDTRRLLLQTSAPCKNLCLRKKEMGYTGSSKNLQPLWVIGVKITSFPNLPILWEHRTKPQLPPTQDPGTRLPQWNSLRDTVTSHFFLPRIQLTLNITGPGDNPWGSSQIDKHCLLQPVPGFGHL